MDDVCCPARPLLFATVRGAVPRVRAAAEAGFPGCCLVRCESVRRMSRRPSPAATRQRRIPKINEIAVLSRPVCAVAVARCHQWIDCTVNTGRYAEAVSPVSAIGRLAYGRRRDGGRGNTRRLRRRIARP